MIYSMKYIFGLHPFWHKAPKTLGISQVLTVTKVSCCVNEVTFEKSPEVPRGWLPGKPIMRLEGGSNSQYPPQASRAQGLETEAQDWISQARGHVGEH